VIEVLLVDDHPIVRRGLALLLEAEPDLSVCGEAADAASALGLLATTTPTVIIVDVSLAGSSGLDLVRELKERLPRVAVLVVSMHDELLYAERSLRAGASGYVMKSEATEVVVRAVRAVAAGKIFVGDDVSLRALRQWAQGALRGKEDAESSALSALSDREIQVLELIGRGVGTRAISELLHISVKTVESYRARLKVKMNLRSGLELMRFAMQWIEAPRTDRQG
jgi:DNA-binding NarL/FixJ family response regulator